MQGLEHLNSLYDRIEYFQNALIAQATGGNADDGHYQLIRKEALDKPTISNLLPRWVRVNRNLSQFWQ